MAIKYKFTLFDIHLIYELLYMKPAWSLNGYILSADQVLRIFNLLSIITLTKQRLVPACVFFLLATIPTYSGNIL